MGLIELATAPRKQETLERKRDLSSPEGVLKTLVAFANTDGGVLLIGVEEQTRHVLGVSDALVTDGWLTNFVADTIRPRLAGTGS